MKIIGLTGGIGSGKSAVAKMFQSHSVPVYNADKEAKVLLNTSIPLRKQLILLLGNEAYDYDKINKGYISDKIFNDKNLLNKMNQIVHPAVREHFLKWVDQQEADYVIQETAIIFENDSQQNYHKIILVTAPQAIRIKRVRTRDGVTSEQVLARMQNQLSDQEKIPLSDFVIHNIDLEETATKVSEINMLLLENS